MICNACGANHFPGDSSCPKCGAGLMACCPGCAAEVHQGARFCSACGQSLDPQIFRRANGDGQTAKPLTGARKQATILFADFSGFTTFAAQLDPEELRDTMNALWTKLDAIIVAHGGNPEKHSGDGLMAVFGGARAREEDPAEAVRAALEMQEWLPTMKCANGRPALPLRIGIHTGLVVVGPADTQGEFLATGDAVNVARRLEQNAPATGVLISSETYRHVFGFFDAQPQPLLTVKGKSEPVTTYLILRAKPRGLALQMRGIEGVETEMVGRQEQLKRLLDSFQLAMATNTPQFLTIVGEAGMGKSRLLHEFQKRCELLPQYFRLLYARGSTETSRLPFALVRDLFLARFEIQESDPGAMVRQKFERGLEGLLTDDARPGLPPELVQDIHFFGQLLGLDFSASPHLRNILADPDQIRQRAFNGFSRLIAAMSRNRARQQELECKGVLLIIEDLHWCDDGSLDLVGHLIQNCAGVPLIILGSARPIFFERHPDWCAGLPNIFRVSLDSLSPQDSHALVQILLRKVPEIPPALRELVTNAAEGNPFYIEEMIKMLMDQKVILPQMEPWRIDLERLVDARVPTTLTGVLQARLDSLSAGERMVIQRASVVGRIFWDSAVEQTKIASGGSGIPDSSFEGDLSAEQLTSALEALCRKELIFRREASAFADTVEYTFKHELLRTVAYESLLKKSRRQHHARIAEWLKVHSGDRTHEFAGLVAAHYEQAARPAEAAEWHGRAGHQARLGYAPAMASESFKKALQLVPADGSPESARQQLDWQEGLFEALDAQARFADAEAAGKAMLSLAQQLADPVAEARAWNNLAFLHERRGDNRASIQCTEHAETLARSADEAGHAEHVRALHFKGWACYRLGDAPAVLALGDQTLALCTAQDDRRGTAISFKLLGVAHLQLGNYEDADRFFKQGLMLFQELGDQRNAAAMLSNVGETARSCSDYQTAAELYERALRIARRIDNRGNEMIYLTNLSGARLGLSQFAQAEKDLRQVIDQTTTPNSCTLSEAFTFLSEACLGQGKLTEAIQTAEKAIALAKESESSLYLGGAWRSLGRARSEILKSPSDSTAVNTLPNLAGPTPQHCFAESLRVFREMKAEGEQARTLRAWGEYELAAGNAESGRNHLVAAREIFQRLNVGLELADMEKRL